MFKSDYDSWLFDVPEEKPLAYDFSGQELYEGDYVYNCSGLLIHEDDFVDYVKRKFLHLLEIEEDTEDWRGELIEAGEMAYLDIDEQGCLIINDDWEIEAYFRDFLEHYRLEK